MRRAGLQVRTIINLDQATGYQCGDNSAAWACMLRMLGPNFFDLTHEAAAAINVPEHPRAQRPQLGKAADDTSWLIGDEIVNLVAVDNPDGPGTQPEWLKGPAPLNYFFTYFEQSTVDGEESPRPDQHHGGEHSARLWYHPHLWNRRDALVCCRLGCGLGWTPKPHPHHRYRCRREARFVAMGSCEIGRVGPKTSRLHLCSSMLFISADPHTHAPL
jgi:hypothetical protein